MVVNQCLEHMNKGFQEVTQLVGGQSFGELALINSHVNNRAATIKCLNDCHFGILSKKDYDRTLKQHTKGQMDTFIKFMKNTPQFREWTKNTLSKFFYSWRKQVYYKDQLVYKEGTKSSRVYLILDGEFEQYKMTQFEKEDTF